MDGSAEQELVKFPYGSNPTTGGQVIEAPNFGSIGVGDTIDSNGGCGSTLSEYCYPGPPMVFWHVAPNETSSPCVARPQGFATSKDARLVLQ